jgi:integrase
LPVLRVKIKVMNTLPRWPRSSETVDDYTDLVRRLGRRFAPESGAAEGAFVCSGAELWIAWIERLRVQPWSEVTVRRYRSALLWFLESLDTFPQSPFWMPPEHRERIEDALRLPWAAESVTVPERRKSPGKRMRSFGRERWDKVRKRLQEAGEWETVLWMESVMRVGVRPVEWVRGVQWDEKRLTVPCAKGAIDETGKRIRGLETERVLDLQGWPEPERNMIAVWARLRATPEERAALLKQMAKRLRWAWDREFGSLRPRITLYTARHQFAANLRAHRVDAVAIAAMMGHSSDRTQQAHYGRGAHGKTGQGITPPEVSALLTAQVRQHQGSMASLPKLMRKEI